MKVLIADDSQIMRKIIRTNLLKLGIDKVFDCPDGATAIKTLVANPDIKLLFTDLNMPVLSGYELIKQIRSIPKLRNLAIVVISDHLGKNADKSLDIFDVKGYVPKPFNIVNFNETTAPILEALRNPTDSDGGVSKIGLPEFIGLLGSEKPAVKLDSAGLSVIFSNYTFDVTLENFMSVADVKLSKA
ncbi:MAG: hypothetical protein RL154_639 [Pseudomonadota bacterium]